MKKISEHNIPLSPDHFQHDIWLLTDKVFAEKDLDETIAHGLSQYVHTYYDFLVKNKKVDTAHIFLATYTKVLHEIEKIKNKDELQKIAKVLENWLDGVEKIYEDSKDMGMYLDGHRKMFNVVFEYFTGSPMRDLEIIHTQHYLADALQQAA